MPYKRFSVFPILILAVSILLCGSLYGRNYSMTISRIDGDKGKLIEEWSPQTDMFGRQKILHKDHLYICAGEKSEDKIKFDTVLDLKNKEELDSPPSAGTVRKLLRKRREKPSDNVKVKGGAIVTFLDRDTGERIARFKPGKHTELKLWKDYYIYSKKGGILGCYNYVSQQRIWEREFDIRKPGDSISGVDDMILIPGRENILAVDLRTGTKLWSTPFPNLKRKTGGEGKTGSIYEAVRKEEDLIFRTSKGFVCADYEKGDIKWVHPCDPAPLNSIYLLDGDVFTVQINFFHIFLKNEIKNAEGKEKKFYEKLIPFLGSAHSQKKSASSSSPRNFKNVCNICAEEYENLNTDSRSVNLLAGNIYRGQLMNSKYNFKFTYPQCSTDDFVKTLLPLIKSQSENSQYFAGRIFEQNAAKELVKLFIEKDYPRDFPEFDSAKKRFLSGGGKRKVPDVEKLNFFNFRSLLLDDPEFYSRLIVPYLKTNMNKTSGYSGLKYFSLNILDDYPDLKADISIAILREFCEFEQLPDEIPSNESNEFKAYKKFELFTPGFELSPDYSFMNEALNYLIETKDRRVVPILKKLLKDGSAGHSSKVIFNPDKKSCEVVDFKMLPNPYTAARALKNFGIDKEAKKITKILKVKPYEQIFVPGESRIIWSVKLTKRLNLYQKDSGSHSISRTRISGRSLPVCMKPIRGKG